MKCQNCGADIPDVSRFCLSCGKEIPPPMVVPVQGQQSPEPQAPEPDPDPNGYSMLLFGLSFMMFFFALAPLFLGLWIGAAMMMGVGLVLVAVGYNMLRSNRREIAKKQELASAKIKCRYCGTLNDQQAQRCDACGAGL